MAHSKQLWDSFSTLGVPKPKDYSLLCAGYTDGNQRCSRQLSSQKEKKVGDLLRVMELQAPNKAIVNLRPLARLLFCTIHQDLIDDKVEIWEGAIEVANSFYQRRVKLRSQNLDLKDELDKMADFASTIQRTVFELTDEKWKLKSDLNREETIVSQLRRKLEAETNRTSDKEIEAQEKLHDQILQTQLAEQRWRLTLRDAAKARQEAQQSQQWVEALSTALTMSIESEAGVLNENQRLQTLLNAAQETVSNVETKLQRVEHDKETADARIKLLEQELVDVRQESKGLRLQAETLNNQQASIELKFQQVEVDLVLTQDIQEKERSIEQEKRRELMTQIGVLMN